MEVITISRGTFSGGKLLAERLSATLGYRCIDRDEIVARAAGCGVSSKDLLSALATPPANQTATLNHRKYIYLAVVQAALAEEILSGRVIYHGHAGHLLLNAGITVLRLRVVAPMEFRIRMAQERLGLSRTETIAHIHKMDAERRRWTQFLYGVDWEDPSLYDLVLNLEHFSIETATRVISGMIKEAGPDFWAEAQAALKDFALASRVRAELALKPLTSHLEVKVQSRGGAITVKSSPFEEQEEVRQAVLGVPGVAGLTFEELAPAA
jgi:cytidylate kinase